MNYPNLSKVGLGLLLSSMSLFAVDASNGAKIIDNKCTACHTGNIKDGLSRISDQRKTPEGWYMTLQRMKRHGLSLTGNEEQDVIKYLADKQGLTHEEIKPFTYVLDKTPNFQAKDPESTLLAEMCVRCHSDARIGLQRRTADEWDGLVNFHVAKFISFEVQAQARDRDWFGIAQKEIVPYLAEHYGKDTKKYEEYQKLIKNEKLPLSWSFYGHNATNGDFTASLELTKSKDDSYKATYTEVYANGKTFEAQGIAILYSGSELRVSLKDKDEKRFQQVLHIDRLEKTVNGRVYETLHHEIGSLVNGVASDKKATYITGIYPKAIKAGKKAILTITGANLSSDITLPDSLKLLKVVSKTKNKVELEVLAKDTKTTKAYDIKVNKETIKNSIAVYDKVDSIKITPEFAIARYGKETEKIKKEYAAFEAVGFNNGPDGKPNTKDDIFLGTLPALWNMEPYDHQAEEDKDILFAGSIDRYTGVFTPSEGGPNPSRKLNANNVGNLKVTATYFVKDGEKLTAESHLISTVPKFVNPPIN